MKKLIWFSILLTIAMSSDVFAQVVPKQREAAMLPGDKSKFYLFLLAGQSNMAGRGNIEAVDTISNKHMKKWKIGFAHLPFGYRTGFK